MSTQQKLFKILEAAELLGVGRTTVYGLIGSGELRSVRIGRRHLVPADALDDFVEKLQRDAAA